MTLPMRNTIAQNFTAWAGGLIPHEMRRGNRLQVHMPVHITYEGLLNKVSQDRICTDISETGIGFRTHAGLFVGENVELGIPAAGRDAFPLPGEAALLRWGIATAPLSYRPVTDPASPVFELV
jgi:hypothetical protein